MLFDYRRNQRKAKLLAAIYYLASVSLVLSLVAYSVFVIREPSIVLGGKITFAVVVLVIPFLVWHLISLNRAVGEWKIQVSPSEVVWEAPKNIREESFSLPIRDISAVVHESSRSNENDNHYFIETVTGKTYFLQLSYSGIPIQKFCRSLEKAGVRYEERIKN